MPSLARHILERHAIYTWKELTNACIFLTWNLKKTDRLENLHVNERTAFKIDLKEVEWDGVGWIRLRVENTDGLL